MLKIFLNHLLRTWSQHFALQFATLVVLTGTFTVITLSLLIHENLNLVLTRWGDSITMSVYLKDEKSEVDKLLSKIKSYPEVEKIEYINKEEAVEIFKEQVKGFVPEMMFDSGFENPLPASFEIKFNSSNWTTKKYDEMVLLGKELLKFTEVDEVSYGQNWVKNYASAVSKFNTSSLILVLVLLSGSLFVVGNSIRNSISQRKEEIEILELIGSTRWAIRTPYVLEGITIGFIASLLSLVLVYILYKWQFQSIDSGLGFLGGQLKTSFISNKNIFSTLILGAIFGFFGSWICVSKLSNGWSAQQAEQ